MRIDRYTPPPNHPLYPFIDSIWRVENCFSYTNETILPKQTVDILFNLGPTSVIARETDTYRADLSGFHVAGPQLCGFVALAQGETKMLGISLKVDGSSAFLPLPLTEIVNQAVEGRDIFPDQRFLLDQVGEAPSFEAQCHLLMRWLLQIIQPTPHLHLVQYACKFLREEPASHTLDQISTRLHLSSRHLRRLMLRHVGIGPGEYMRLSRFAKALYMMPQNSSLTDISYHVHYADQAHFSRDFKEIAGMTPSEYRQRMSHVPGHIFTK